MRLCSPRQPPETPPQCPTPSSPAASPQPEYPCRRPPKTSPKFGLVRAARADSAARITLVRRCRKPFSVFLIWGTNEGSGRLSRDEIRHCCLHDEMGCHRPCVSGLSAFPRCRFPRLPWPVRSTCSFSCREDGSIFCLGSPRRPTSTSLARFPRRPEHGTARARLLARAPSSKSRRAFVGKTSDATLLSSRGG